MANLHCAAHDKIFPEGGFCEACGLDTVAVKVAPLAYSEYCAIHDKTFSRNTNCPGCDPSVIEAQNALVDKSGKHPKTHCAVHDQIFEGNVCPAGCVIEVPGTKPAEPVESVEPVA